jgi:hypothetical protein
MQRKEELSFKLPLCPLTLALASTLLFQMFFLAFSSSQGEKKHKKTKKKNHKKEKKMHRNEGAFLQASTMPFHFWLPLLPSPFCPSVSNVFS